MAGRLGNWRSEAGRWWGRLPGYRRHAVFVAEVTDDSEWMRWNQKYVEPADSWFNSLSDETAAAVHGRHT